MKKIFGLRSFAFLLTSVLLPLIALGQNAPSLGDVAATITSSFGGITQLIIGIATVAGLGFGVAAIFKFKQHRDNPTQVPLGQPLALLAIGVMLLWVNYLLMASGTTLTGGEGTPEDAQSKIGERPGWLGADDGGATP